MPDSILVRTTPLLPQPVAAGKLPTVKVPSGSPGDAAASDSSPAPNRRPPARSAGRAARPTGAPAAAVSLRKLAVGGLAVAGTVQAASRQPVPISLAETAHLPGETVGPEPGIPFVARGSLKVPLKTYVAHMLAEVGQKEASLEVVEADVLAVRRKGGRPEFTAQRLEQAMKTYTPEAVDSLLDAKSPCGRLTSSLSECLRTVRKECARLDEQGRLQLTTEPADCDRYTRISGRLVALANIARLAVMRVTPEVEHQFSVPFGRGPADVLSQFGGAVTLHGGDMLKGPNARTFSVVLANLAVLLQPEPGLVSTGSDFDIVKTFVHEVWHALTNGHFTQFLHDTFPEDWKPLMEFITEFLATHYVTRDAEDLPYETKHASNRFMIRVLEAMTGTAPLNEHAYQEGVKLVKRAFLFAEGPVLERLAAAIKSVVEVYGRPRTQLENPESADPDIERTPSSATRSPSDRVTAPPPPTGGPRAEPPPEADAPENDAGWRGAAVAATLAAAGLGAVAVALEAARRRANPEATETNPGVSGPTEPDALATPEAPRRETSRSVPPEDTDPATSHRGTSQERARRSSRSATPSGGQSSARASQEQPVEAGPARTVRFRAVLPPSRPAPGTVGPFVALAPADAAEAVPSFAERASQVRPIQRTRTSASLNEAPWNVPLPGGFKPLTRPADDELIEALATGRDGSRTLPSGFTPLASGDLTESLEAELERMKGNQPGA